MALQEGMQVVDVHGIPTHVYCRHARSAKSPFIMVVTGSPGMVHFYIPFVDRIFELHGGRSQVCVIGQAGHSPGVAKETTSNNGRDWYSLEDQVEHKLAFLERYARDRDSLYLIGHSIGCYMHTALPDHRANGRDSQWHQASSSIQHTAPSLHSYLLATVVAAALTQDLPPQPQQQVE